MSKPLLTDGDTKVFVTPDLESETYEAFSLVGMRGGKAVWTEGIRKDRSAMRDDYRRAIEAFLAK